jgi:hypothetical protein
MNGPQHSVRRILLPSGKAIEVVRFEQRQTGGAQTGLHMCPACGSELVQPVQWQPAVDGCWELTLHCPNCSWRRDGVYTQGEVDHLEEQLDLGVEALVRDLQRLTSANMADEIDRFATALDADLILPEDF